MNNVELIGRLTTDPELRYTQDEKAYVRQTIAVNRGISKEDKEAGKQSADFISCIFWNQTAENLAKYMKKGSQIAVAGKLRTGKYEAQDGTTRYTTDVRVIELIFLDSKPKDTRPEPEYDGYESPKAEQRRIENDPFADFGESVEISDNDLPF